MKQILFYFFVFTFSFQSFCQEDSWSLIFENDKEGATVTGNKEDLIDAIRKGQTIKIAWSSQRPNDPSTKVEHAAIAKFTTIMSNSTVFAQIDPIIGQTPDFKEQKISLKENLEWTLIAASNGKSDSMMRNTISGEILGHQIRQRGFKWFVKN